MIVLPLPCPSAKRSLVAVGERSERQSGAEKKPKPKLGLLFLANHVDDADEKRNEANNPIDYCEALFVNEHGRRLCESPCSNKRGSLCIGYPDTERGIRSQAARQCAPLMNA
jgi:hypothetical protein